LSQKFNFINYSQVKDGETLKENSEPKTSKFLNVISSILIIILKKYPFKKAQRIISRNDKG